MITIRRNRDRVHCTQHDGELWQTFGEATPGELGFCGLAYLDEAWAGPGQAVARRPEDAAEVVLYVCEGGITLHPGRTEVPLAAGGFVREAAGGAGRVGVRNGSRERAVHVFRIGLEPLAAMPPSDLAWAWFSVAQRRDALRVVASWDGREGSVGLAQEAVISSAVLGAGRHVVHEIAAGFGAWLHLVSGRGRLGALELMAGDGVGLRNEPSLSFTSSEESELLLIELPR